MQEAAKTNTTSADGALSTPAMLRYQAQTFTVPTLLRCHRRLRDCGTKSSDRRRPHQKVGR